MSDTLNRKLSSIPVRTEISSGNIPPLLHEIRHALNRLLQSGDATVIDLKSIPLAPGELDKILDTLGRGEVQADLNALGRSEIRETSYAGVWIVSHYDESEELKTVLIEVTRFPAILQAQQDDMIEAARRLEIVLGA